MDRLGRRLIDKWVLSNAFRIYPGELHTSSEGRKVNVAVDSIHANYAFQYFGKDKGVTMYTFVDERHSLFYSTVNSASDREAAFVIDGLLQNDVGEYSTGFSRWSIHNNEIKRFRGGLRPLMSSWPCKRLDSGRSLTLGMPAGTTPSDIGLRHSPLPSGASGFPAKGHRRPQAGPVVSEFELRPVQDGHCCHQAEAQAITESAAGTIQAHETL